MADSYLIDEIFFQWLKLLNRLLHVTRDGNAMLIKERRRKYYRLLHELYFVAIRENKRQEDKRIKMRYDKRIINSLKIQINNNCIYLRKYISINNIT